MRRLSKQYPLQIRERTPNLVKADFHGYNVPLKEDFTVRYALRLATSRHPARDHPARDGLGPGILSGAGAAENSGQRAPTTSSGRPRREHSSCLFDNSLSMQWDKLERSFAACEAALRRLRAVDSFNLMLFNSELTQFAPQPRPATPENIEQALAFVRNSRIRGGTGVQRALTAALAADHAQARPISC